MARVLIVFVITHNYGLAISLGPMIPLIVTTYHSFVIFFWPATHFGILIFDSPTKEFVNTSITILGLAISAITDDFGAVIFDGPANLV